MAIVKKYLITNFHKLNYPSGSELIFIDEILFHLYTLEDRLNYKCSYVLTIEEAHKIKNSINIFIKKKLKIYRNKLGNLLNFYHKTKNTNKYWGIIIDQFLIELLETIILEIKILKKIKIKNFQPIQENIKNYNCLGTEDFQYYMLSADFKKLLSSLILKDLNSKLLNLKYSKSNIIYIQYKNLAKFYNRLLKFFIRFYINFFKPVLLVNGYFGLNNTIYLFFRSFGKIINVPDKLLFNRVNYKTLINYNFRKKIKVIERDIVDRIFNKLIKNVLPCNFLENFNFIQNDIKKLSENVKVIGTGNCQYFSDHFNILNAEILKKNNAKFLTFQHGALISQTNLLSIEYSHKTYAHKTYNFNDPKGLGQHFFKKKKISVEEIKQRNLILILTANYYFDRNLRYNPATYVFSDPSFIFFKNLSEFNKNKVILKLSPKPNHEKVKNYWKKKFSNKINIIPSLLNANKESFCKAKIVILNEISTPLYELIFLGLPFILICDYKSLSTFHYKNSFCSKFKRLKFINVLFEDPVIAANFVNSFNQNYSIDDWWNKVNKTKIFIDFKKFLIMEKNNYLPKIFNELKKLNI